VRSVLAMDLPLSSSPPPARELLLTGALLSAYIGLRAVTAALAIAESIPARPGRSLRALA
jgi:hypothetical protein